MHTLPIPTPPDNVTAAAADLAKVRVALSRHAQADKAAKAQLATADAEHVRESADAALEGTPAPKTSAALKALRESVETSAGVLRDLEARERAAKGAHESAVNEWGWALVRAQIASDVSTGRKGLEDAAAALRVVVDALGEEGFRLLRVMLETMPATVRFARVERIASYNGIFAGVGHRNPAQDIGPGMLIEAGCPNADEARRLVSD